MQSGESTLVPHCSVAVCRTRGRPCRQPARRRTLLFPCSGPTAPGTLSPHIVVPSNPWGPQWGGFKALLWSCVGGTTTDVTLIHAVLRQAPPSCWRPALSQGRPCPGHRRKQRPARPSVLGGTAERGPPPFRLWQVLTRLNMEIKANLYEKAVFCL